MHPLDLGPSPQTDPLRVLRVLPPNTPSDQRSESGDRPLGRHALADAENTQVHVQRRGRRGPGERTNIQGH